MARLESQAKLGYFKTPVEIAEIITSFLDIDEDAQGTRIFDPCAGTGEAIDIIANRLQQKNPSIKTFGIELDKERAEQAKRKLTKVVCGDINRIRAKKGSFSLMLLNPPYHKDPEDDQRLEAKFLTMTTPYLRTDGILIYIIPQTSLSKRVARYLANWYKDFTVCRFPGESYDRFKQIVVIAVKKPPKTAINDEVLARLQDVPGALLKDLEERKEPVYTVPKNSIDNKTFYMRSLDLNMEELQKEVDDYGAWSMAKGLMHPRVEDVRGKVLMPLRKGHLAVLIACGLSDGLIEKGNKRLLIKGLAKKEQNTTIEHAGDMITEKTTDRIKVGIMAIDLNTGEMINVE